MAGAGAGDGDLIEQRQQLRVVPGLPGGEQDGHWQSAPVDGQGQLAGQSAAGAAEGFAVDGEGFDRVAAAPFFRAPAACWWARTEVESTLKVQSTTPTASFLTTTSARIRSHVPSAVHF